MAIFKFTMFFDDGQVNITEHDRIDDMVDALAIVASNDGNTLPQDTRLALIRGDRFKIGTTEFVCETIDPLYTYVLMRTDVLDYQNGKAMAQSHHAGTAMIARALRSKNEELAEDLDQWLQVADGFGTCIVKEVSAADMRQAVSLATLMGLHSGIVNDPSYPIWDGERIQTISLDTCAFVFGRVSRCRPAVGKYPLLKKDA